MDGGHHIVIIVGWYVHVLIEVLLRHDERMSRMDGFDIEKGDGFLILENDFRR